jgi:hypothetical protein
MKTVILTVLLAACSGIAGELIKDVDGWQEAKLGMSQPVITEAYKGQVKPKPSYSTKQWQFLELLEPVMIADNRFTVVFRFDERSKELDTVTLSPVDFKTNPEVLLGQMLALLIEKYGLLRLRKRTKRAAPTIVSTRGCTLLPFLNSYFGILGKSKD